MRLLCQSSRLSSGLKKHFLNESLDRSYMMHASYRYFMVGELNHTVPMRGQPLYTEDWIGLQELDRNNKIHFKLSL